MEAIITTGGIDSKKKRDVIMSDIPNMFVHIEITLDRDIIIMKIRRQLVNILLVICSGLYVRYIQYKRKQKILYVQILKVLYGMLVS